MDLLPEIAHLRKNHTDYPLFSNKKWQHMFPKTRWSSPELCSSATTVVLDHREDEESTLHDGLDNQELKRKSIILLCKALMLYGSPCHRIVNITNNSNRVQCTNPT